MNKKQLIELGLDEKLAEDIIVLHGKDIEKHKSAIETSNQELETLRAQLAEAGVTIEGFKKLDIAGIQKAADDWKLQAETAKTESEKNIASLKFNHALDDALKSAKVRNTKAVRALLQSDALSLEEDGSVKGLDDQLKKVKETDTYLFEDDEDTPQIVTGGNSQSILGDVVVEGARKAAGLPTK